MLFNSLTEEIGTCILHDRPDTWSCTLSSDGNYTVKSTRDYLDKRMLPSSNVTSVWFKFLPRKVNVFLWRLRLDSLPARWNLFAKGIEINSIVCPVCSNGVETRDHLFFDCEMALDLWHKIGIWLDCDMPCFSSWDSFMAWIEGVRLQVSSKNRIIAVVVSMLWAIWHFRNGIVFSNAFCSKSSLFDIIRLLTFRWIKNRGHLVSKWNLWLAMPL
ncbi:uncharacterized protein [Rutidosis leptorrhynchoides]|uniref:uncharacterized protein n=1 Tax=Rutidosis leptorrhynchoides TaxID=125765 RepID=UPI003A99F358